jgi:uncharacterized membrane protein YhhN
MWSTPYPWAAAVAFCAGLAVWGKHPSRMVVHWIFKPLATTLIGAVAALMIPQGPSRTWVLVALALSLAGDVLLMLGDRLFTAGLGAFLLAQIAWAVAFTLQIPLAPRQLVYLILPVAVAALILLPMWKHLGKYRWPVLIYVLCIAGMGWRAFSRFDALDVSLADWLWGCFGAAFFMTGDTLLARRRFLGKPVRYSIELGVYYVAQWCLVASMY